MFSSASALRQSSPIRAYVGPNGGGKTLAAVNDLLPSLDEGRMVLSTVQLYLPDGTTPHPGCVLLTHWGQLIEWEEGDVLLDEVTGVMNARKFSEMPGPLQDKVVQLRRNDCTVAWTTPSWSRADVIMREVTQSVTVCKGYMRTPAPCRRCEQTRKRCRCEDGGRFSRWPQNRLFRWVTYDASDFEAFELEKADRLRPLATQVAYRSKTMRAARQYRTLQAVTRLTHADATGACVKCGGYKARVKCACDHEQTTSGGRPARPARPAPALLLDS